MGRKAFQAIAEGLEDALAFTRGEKARGHAIGPSTRCRRGSHKRETWAVPGGVATAFGVSVSTVRNWEQGRRTPEGPALVLLTVIEKAPRTVLRSHLDGADEKKGGGLTMEEAD